MAPRHAAVAAAACWAYTMLALGPTHRPLENIQRWRELAFVHALTWSHLSHIKCGGCARYAKALNAASGPAASRPPTNVREAATPAAAAALGGKAPVVVRGAMGTWDAARFDDKRYADIESRAGVETDRAVARLRRGGGRAAVGRVAAPPRLPRGSSEGTGRGTAAGCHARGAPPSHFTRRYLFQCGTNGTAALRRGENFKGYGCTAERTLRDGVRGPGREPRCSSSSDTWSRTRRRNVGDARETKRGRMPVFQDRQYLRGRRVLPRLSSAETGRGGAAATTWLFRGGGDGRDLDFSREDFGAGGTRAVDSGAGTFSRLFGVGVLGETR